MISTLAFRPGLAKWSAALAVSTGVLLVGGCGSGKTTSAPTTSESTSTSSTTAASTSTAVNSTSSSVVVTTTAPAQTTGGCQNLVATVTVKAAVTSTYGQVATGGALRLVHIAPAPGVFFYGECATRFYAATRFVPTAGATVNEDVALQDDGATMKYFSQPQGGTWSLIASQGFPGTQGCGTITQLPTALANLWNECPSGL